MEIKKQTNLRGELTVPGDKSISHRAVMFGSLAKGTTRISHFLEPHLQQVGTIVDCAEKELRPAPFMDASPNHWYKHPMNCRRWLNNLAVPR